MNIFFAIVLIVAIAHLVMEFKRTMMMLQQNSYRNERYMRWLGTSGDSTSMNRLLTIIVLLVALIPAVPENIGMGMIFAVSASGTWKLVTAKYKKPLVFTKRVWRIFITMSVISLVALGIAGYCMWDEDVTRSLYVFSVGVLAVYALSHVMTVVANTILVPVEKSINRRYYNDAARILASMPNLKVIGITGSYGKTSTKHYLNRILSEKYDVLMTPGSFNTILGVIRTVREHLKPYNEVFIVEMGAKQPGDISEICELVHPSMGIVTAVGEQHLESFKSIENVQRTKFELIDALPHAGLGVVNDDFPYIANRPVKNVKCVRYAVNAIGNADYTVKDIEYDETGTRFVIVGNGREITLHTRLIGECNVSNLVAAVIIALDLEVPEEKIRYAVEKIEQVEHRLNLKRTPTGITIIDDAFNSNPTGSGRAMDVLGRMTKGKRIVITPGMIELGEKQYELNEALGVKISTCADVAIIVGEYNRDALLGGITKGGGLDEKNVYAVASFGEAQRVLGTIAVSGDTVLYENDLPDTFK